MEEEKDEKKRRPEIVVETATARDVLEAMFGAHGGHSVANVDVINEAGAVISCSCGELLPFGPEEAEGVGWKATGVVERLKKLGKDKLMAETQT